MSIFSKIAGVINTFFQFGGPGSPGINANSGVLEAKNAANNAFVIMRGADPVGNNDFVTKEFLDGYPFPASPSYLAVSQASHGFTTGEAVYYTGSAWALAEANAANTLGIGIVSYVDTNDFNLYQTGLITGLSALTAGQYYYVSDSSAGALTATEPTSTSSYSNPILFALSTTSGLVLPFRPSKVFTATAYASNYDFLLDNEPTEPGTTYSNTIVGSSITVENWNITSSGALLKKIAYTYTGSLITTEVRKIFAADGITIVAELSISYSYTGIILSGAVYTRVV